MNIETIITKLQGIAAWYQMPEDDKAVIMAACDRLEALKWQDCEYIKGKLKGGDRMNREQALNYMRSSGWSEEQINTVTEAFTCEDTISRQAAIDLACKVADRIAEGDNRIEVKDCAGHVGEEIMYALHELPPVSVAEKVGRWIEKEDWNGDTYYDCSVCGESFSLIEGTPTDNLYNYCPSCGAKMGVEE